MLVDDVFSHVSAREAKELGYRSYSDSMEAGLLHPNCRHTISTYFPGITQLPEVTDTNKALNTYRAEQKQREFERKIRKWKRKEEGSCDPVNISQARKKVKQYRDELEEHMDRHPELRRDYDREKNR